MDFRNPLSIALDAAVTGGAPSFAPTMPQTTLPEPQKLSRGQLMLGVLADALAGAQGRQGAFAAQMGQQRQQEREQAQWGLQRKAGLEDYEAKQRIDQRYAKPDISPMERDARAWMSMSPEMQAAYRTAQAAKPQFIPDGYGGGQWAKPPVLDGPKPPQTIDENLWNTGKPVGGQTPASGGFRR